MSEVVFIADEDRLQYRALFIKDGHEVSNKWLTSVEEDALEEFLPEPGKMKAYDAIGMYEELDNLCFDNDGQQTNFEVMVFELVKKEYGIGE